MPADYCLRLDNEDPGPPVVPDLAQPSPQESIGRGEFRTFDRTLQNPELMAQGEDLQSQGRTAPERSGKRREERRKERAERESKEDRQPSMYQSDRN
jgi:hypothetical protein